jgi:hypothetical protein
LISCRSKYFDNTALHRIDFEYNDPEQNVKPQPTSSEIHPISGCLGGRLAMISGSIQTGFSCKEAGGPKSGRSPEEHVEDETLEDEEAFIVCRHCSQLITRPADRILKDGLHRHTFANPHGIVYEIGCFGAAVGCGYSGAPTYEFTWFKGYQWRIAVCAACLTHLGWLFTSSGGDQFHGLILDRLKQPD